MFLRSTSKVNLLNMRWILDFTDHFGQFWLFSPNLVKFWQVQEFSKILNEFPSVFEKFKKNNDETRAKLFCWVSAEYAVIPVEWIFKTVKSSSIKPQQIPNHLPSDWHKLDREQMLLTQFHYKSTSHQFSKV